MNTEPKYAEDMELDEWLDAIQSGNDLSDVFTDYRFPTEDLLNEFIERIQEWDEQLIRLLLRKFLDFGPSLGIDDTILDGLIRRNNVEVESEERDFYRRLLNGKIDTWSSLTWIIDCLPNYPRQALAVIDAYFFAHMQQLPDGRYNSLEDSRSIIRSKYISPVTSDRMVDDLSSREFEFIVAAIFARSGYDVVVTQESRDGGCDVIATRQTGGVTERILVECKLHRSRVGVAVARGVLGILEANHATKGCIVSTADFTKDARKIATKTARLDLHGPQWLSNRLNSEYGIHWANRVDQVISEGRRAAAQSDVSQ